jgi:hypothetical protein
MLSEVMCIVTKPEKGGALISHEKQCCKDGDRDGYLSNTNGILATLCYSACQPPPSNKVFFATGYNLVQFGGFSGSSHKISLLHN